MNATAAQIRAIQTLRRKAGLDEASYRGLLQGRAGVGSSRDLTIAAANDVIAVLRGQSSVGRPSHATVSGPYAAKLRALWLAGWNLGVVRERDDRALLAFVERQTGLSHTRFLTDARAASRAIEALKSWLTREAGVAWPRDGRNAEAAKEAVTAAQLARLRHHDLSPSAAEIAGTPPDAIQRSLGRTIRKLRIR